MKRNIAIAGITIVAFLALVLGVSFQHFSPLAPFNHAQIAEDGLFVYDPPRPLSEFALSDHTGAPFTRYTLTGKWSLLFFGYTFCPDICPITLATIRQFEQLLIEADPELAGQVQVALISVDPQRDTQDKLAQYVGYFSPDYLGVRGEYVEVFNFTRQLNVAFAYTPAENGAYLVSHSGEIALINPDGNVHGFFRAPHEPERMLRNFSIVADTWR